MSAENFSKHILECIYSEEDDDKKVKYLTGILRSIYQMGQGKGENNMRNKISILLNSPEQNADTLRDQIGSILSSLKL